MTDASATEVMITRAAAELADDETVLVGVGIPNLACNLAKRQHAPDLELVYESGVIGADPETLPLSIGDPVLVDGATSVVDMLDGFGRYLQAGRIDVGFLGCAQIDRHGNLNSTVIGDYDDPSVRLPGSGGACEIATNSHRTIVITPHTRRRFVETLDFRTSPGYLSGRGGRATLGMRGGPSVVITDKAVLHFDDSGEMILTELFPGVQVEAVQAATGWDLAVAGELSVVDPPEASTLSLLRDELDPTGIYLE